MLPFLPQELITNDVLALIVSAWADAVPRRRNAFNPLLKTIASTYVGTRRPDAPPRPPRFPPSLWCVSGRRVRTNNAAESVHSTLNPKVSGRLSVFNFLAIIEEAMAEANARVAAGCKSESRAVERRKNELLAVELDKLLNRRQGVLSFLDNCSSVSKLETVRDADRFVPVAVTTFADVDWTATHRDAIAAAASALHRRLRPGRELGVHDVLASVTVWAFQVLPPSVPIVVGSSETLSLVATEPHQSFIALREEVERACCPPQERPALPRPAQERHEAVNYPIVPMWRPFVVLPRVPPPVPFPGFFGRRPFPVPFFGPFVPNMFNGNH